MMEKYRNSSVYSYEKYKPYLDLYKKLDSNNIYLQLSTGDTSFNHMIKNVYYGDFCVN